MHGVDGIVAVAKVRVASSNLVIRSISKGALRGAFLVPRVRPGEGTG